MDRGQHTLVNAEGIVQYLGNWRKSVGRAGSIGNDVVFGGIILILIGGGVYLAAKFGIPLGRLPGDIRIEGKNGSFYFPIVTSIVVSLLLTIILNVIIRFFNR